MNEVSPLDALKRAFANPERGTGAGNYYPFFLMQVDQEAKIRFLPDKNKDNPRLFLVEKVDHRLTINGDVKTTPCLSQYNEECPICKVAQQYYKAEGDDSENGRNYYKKRKYVGQVLVVSDPLPIKEGEESNVGKVMYITLGFQIYNVLKTAVERGFIDALPYDYKNGYDFTIVKSQQGQFSTYALGSTFDRKPRALDDETITFIEENIVDLSTLIPVNPGIEKTEALLNAALTGDSYDERTSAQSPIPVKEAVTPPSKPAEKTFDKDVPISVGEVKETSVVKTKPASTPVDDDDEDDDEDILAQIKARRKAKSS